jgi:hypothetical protein
VGRAAVRAQQDDPGDGARDDDGRADPEPGARVERAAVCRLVARRGDSWRTDENRRRLGRTGGGGALVAAALLAVAPFAFDRLSCSISAM